MTSGLSEVQLGPPSGLPTRACRDVLKLLETPPHVSPLKPPFSEVMVMKKPLELSLVYVNFCSGGHDVVVGLLVLFDVGKESPVTKFSDGLSEHMVGQRWPNESIAEPWGKRYRGLMEAIVRLGIDAGNPGAVVWSTVITKSCHLSISQLFNVLGGLCEAISHGDGEVQNLSLIFLVPLWCFSILSSRGIVKFIL